MTAPPAALTAGMLLGGRVRYAQHATGFRSGIEPVLLAAGIPASPGARVLEAGSGAGAGLLCLAARVSGIAGLGVERDPELAALAARNAAANGFANLHFVAADILAFRDLDGFDHAFANPPYHRPGTASPLAARESAKRGAPGLIADWIAALAAALRPDGTLTLAVPAHAVTETLAGLRAAGCLRVTRFPLHPRAGVAPKLELVQAVRGASGPARIARGLTLHPPPGTGAGPYTEATERILRHGAALDWETAGPT